MPLMGKRQWNCLTVREPFGPASDNVVENDFTQTTFTIDSSAAIFEMESSPSSMNFIDGRRQEWEYQTFSRKVSRRHEEGGLMQILDCKNYK